MKLVILLEEPSAAGFLEEFLPRWRSSLDFLCIPHQGKNDLQKSLPRKLRAWRDADAHFVVLRDNDGKDCIPLKQHLRNICAKAGKSTTLVRLACQELEAWYLGDLSSVGKAYEMPHLLQEQNRAKFRRPDQLESPSRELQRLVPEYRKVQGSRTLGKHLDTAIDNNRSHSFRIFFQGLQSILDG